jgi:Uma2 family endonuclease
MTLGEYMNRERASSVRHEFVRGDVFAMAGGTLRHNRIASNILMQLRAAERGGPCQSFMSDVKVRAGDDVVYYPDVVVDCTPRGGTDLMLDRPCLVVEVTSRSTRRIDRGEKLERYRNLGSLRAYLIVDQMVRRVTHHWRDLNGTWSSEELAGEGSIALSCPLVTLSLDQIYEDIELPPLGVAEPDVDEDADAYEGFY